MSGSIPPNLVLSLVFGVGQLAIGAWLMRYGLRPSHWRQWRSVLAGAAGIWFCVSGVGEMIVSGMEVSRRLNGSPSVATAMTWRLGVDSALYVTTGALVIAMIAYVVALWLIAQRSADRVGSERRP